MEIYDLNQVKGLGYERRQANVLHTESEFKMRVIELAEGGSIPTCEMDSYVVFVAIKGEAEVDVNGEQVTLASGQCLVTDPATLSMTSTSGARLLGVQIVKEG